MPETIYMVVYSGRGEEEGELIVRQLFVQPEWATTPLPMDDIGKLADFYPDTIYFEMEVLL